MSNANKIIDIRDKIHDIKEDFDWFLASNAREGQYLMLKSLRAQFRNTIEVFD